MDARPADVRVPNDIDTTDGMFAGKWNLLQDTIFFMADRREVIERAEGGALFRHGRRNGEPSVKRVPEEGVRKVENWFQYDRNGIRQKLQGF